MYGQIETWDKTTKQGTIFTADSRKPIPFQSSEDWEPGNCVQFDLATIAIRVRKSTGASSFGVIDISSDAARNVGYRDARTGEQVPFHENPNQFTTLGDRDAAIASKPSEPPQSKDSGSVVPIEDLSKSARKVKAWDE